MKCIVMLLVTFYVIIYFMSELKIILEKLNTIKPQLERDFNITQIGIFGSYVRNEQTQDSDVDILIEYDRTKRMSLLKLARLENFLSNLLNKKVDIVTKKALKPIINEYVQKEIVYL